MCGGVVAVRGGVVAWWLVLQNHVTPNGVQAYTLHPICGRGGVLAYTLHPIGGDTT